ncbi:MAG: quinone-dependent dihydroorotate dehydrogenase [Nakamurella sp.]
MTLMERGYTAAVRPFLFRLGHGDAELAHHRTLGALHHLGRRPWARTAMQRLLAVDRSSRRVFGVTFPSVVGVAAGMDKDGSALTAWPALGFGFTEVGTVTAHPQPGNERPRLFRLVGSQAVINRMGFNNAGARRLATRLDGLGPLRTPLGISIGKSKVTPIGAAVEDYLTSLRLLHTYADYIAVNVSSPNTFGLRSLQEKRPLTELLGALTDEAAELAGAGGQPVPILVKISPDLTDSAIGEVLQVCTDTGVAGVIATNTTVSRSGIVARDLVPAGEPGGLSGAPLTLRAREVVSFVSSHTDLPVIGVGGIMNADDGLAMLDAGAALLQIYTGLIYRGPGLVRAINRAVVACD